MGGRASMRARVLLIRSCARPPPPPPLPLTSSEQMGVIAQVGVTAWAFVPRPGLRKGVVLASGYLDSEVVRLYPFLTLARFWCSSACMELVFLLLLKGFFVG